MLGAETLRDRGPREVFTASAGQQRDMSQSDPSQGDRVGRNIRGKGTWCSHLVCCLIVCSLVCLFVCSSVSLFVCLSVCVCSRRFWRHAGKLESEREKAYRGLPRLRAAGGTRQPLAAIGEQSADSRYAVSEDPAPEGDLFIAKKWYTVIIADAKVVRTHRWW